MSRDSTRKEGIIILDCYLTPPASHTKEWATDADAAGNRWTDGGGGDDGVRITITYRSIDREGRPHRAVAKLLPL